MKRHLLVITIIFLLVNLFGCSENTITNTPDLNDNDLEFKFSYTYGSNKRHTIDTHDDSFVVYDSLTSSSKTIKIKLTDQDMKDILDKMTEIDILSYPITFKEQGILVFDAHQEFKIEISAGGNTKSIYWNDKFRSDSAKAIQLRELFHLIQSIINAKSEFKNQFSTPK